MVFGLRERPENADWVHLSEGERVRWSGRPSRYTLAIALVVGLLLAALGIGFTRWAVPFLDERGWPTLLGYLPLGLTAFGIGYAVYRYLLWLRLLYVITDDEIYVKIGLISRDVTQVPLNRVQNTSYDQSVLQRLLSFGTIYVYTAGSAAEDLVFKDVPNPRAVKALLSEQLSNTTLRDQPPYGGV